MASYSVTEPTGQLSIVKSGALITTAVLVLR
jgi:hypothetical protein